MKDDGIWYHMYTVLKLHSVFRLKILSIGCQHQWIFMAVFHTLIFCCCLVMSNSVLTPWTIPCQASLSMGFLRQKYWSGLPFPSPWDLLNPGIEPCLMRWQVGYLPLSHQGSPVFWFSISINKVKKKKKWEESIRLTACFKNSANEFSSHLLVTTASS